jgi:PTH2 family peptidyl-tRNA hydrolase
MKNQIPAKQVIVMRKDLNMRKGKMIAQGAHASLGAILSLMNESPSDNDTLYEKRVLLFPKESAISNWLNGPFKKIAVSVDSEQELLELYETAKKARLPTVLITDSGLTEFNGVPTNTCIAIGPAYEDEINALTGHLKLL